MDVRHPGELASLTLLAALLITGGILARQAGASPEPEQFKDRSGAVRSTASEMQQTPGIANDSAPSSSGPSVAQSEQPLRSTRPGRSGRDVGGRPQTQPQEPVPDQAVQPALPPRNEERSSPETQPADRPTEERLPVQPKPEPGQLQQDRLSQEREQRRRQMELQQQEAEQVERQRREARIQQLMQEQQEAIRQREVERQRQMERERQHPKQE